MSADSLLLNIANWLPRSRANGPGVRMVLWMQGCPFRCHGCQNPDYLTFLPRHILSLGEVWRLFESNPELSGISFSGGEPFAQAVALAELARRVRLSGKTVVCWTGYQLAQLQMGAVPGARDLLAQVDLLIDGLYIESLNQPLPLRGSSNQQLYFLSDRIHPDQLQGIPRQEWTLTEKAIHFSGFPQDTVLSPSIPAEVRQ